MDNTVLNQIGQTLKESIQTIRGTFEMLEHADSYPVKCQWSRVVGKGQELAAQATNLGYLFGGGHIPDLQVFKESMESACIMLQDLVMLTFGSSTEAGPTMVFSVSSSIEEVIKWTSLLLEMGFLTCASKEPMLPSGVIAAVLKACSDLKKTPSTNVIAIGQAMTQVSDSMKDVRHDIEDLIQASSGQPDEASGKASVQAEEDPSEDEEENLSEEEEEDPTEEEEEDPSEDEEEDPNEEEEEDPSEDKEEDPGETLSPEEIERARISADILSELPVVIKELVRCTTGLLQQELFHGGATLKHPLENLLHLCKLYGNTADELSVLLLPEQEIASIKKALEYFANITDEIELEVEVLKASSKDFADACARLRSSLRKLESKLSCSGASDLEQEMKSLAVTK